MEENNNNQVIVDIGLDALIASLRELQKQYEANTAAMKALRDEGKQDSDEYIQLTQANKVLRQEMGGVEKSIQNNIKAEKAQEGSLVQLRAQLANLNKQYDSMSGFERMGTAGEELRKKIKALSDNISSLEANTGRYQRNVGNYKSALEGLSGGFKAAGLSTRGLDQSLRLLNGNPIMLMLTAIVTIGRQLIQAFKGNEQATMALKQAFSAFNPIIDAAKRGLEAFANVIVKVVTTAVNGLTSAVGWLLERVQDIGNFFGADWHMGDNFREGVTAAKELQAAENDYIKAKRAWSVESAKIDREVADLREKASNKEQYNAQQRLDYLNKAIALETRKAEKDKELAQQNLANLQAEAKRSANTAAMNDRLVEAERAVIEADTRLADTKRNLNRQRQSAIREINGETAAISKQTQTIVKQLEAIKMLSIDEYIDAVNKKEQALADSIKKVTDRVGVLQQQLMTLPSAQELLGDMAEATEGSFDVGASNIELFADAYKNSAEIIESTSSSLESSFGSVASMYQQLAKDESKSEAEREAAAKKAKIWSAMQIAANAGTAVAKGVATAVDVGFPAAIPAIGAMVAAILAAIAQAKSLAAEGFETGGVIGGYQGATMGADNTYIHARRGEMVLNAEQQRKLFDIANEGQSGSIVSELIMAIRNMPPPILDYQEFTDFTGRVAAIRETSKLQ